MLHQSIDAGYRPGIAFDAGNLTKLLYEFDGVIYIVSSQQLIKSVIDGIISVSDEDVYNKMDVAMNTFNNAIFKGAHKSYYSDFDLAVLDEYRTKPIVGNVLNVKSNELVEIDISKAYTYSLTQIDQVPVFNDFDNFRSYNGAEIQDYSMYMVSTTEFNLVLNGIQWNSFGVQLK